MWKKLQKVLLKKITVFPEIRKVGPIWQNIIREYPYEPPKTSKKFTFSDHYFVWFEVSVLPRLMPGIRFYNFQIPGTTQNNDLKK